MIDVVVNSEGGIVLAHDEPALRDAEALLLRLPPEGQGGGEAVLVLRGGESRSLGPLAGVLASALRALPPGLREGATLELEELREFLRSHLSGYKLPRSLTVVDTIPRNATGKAQYPAAKEMALASQAEAAPAG